MPMKRKNLHPLNLNPSKNKMSEGESGSLCSREKDFSRHIDDKKIPMADVFLSWVFCFLRLMIPEIDFFAISVYIGITYGTNGMILVGQFHN